MSAAGTAHQKVITLLGALAPSPSFNAVYSTHETANLVVPSLSVEVESDVAIESDGALVQQEIVDNRNMRISIRVHINYRLGPVDTESATDITDEVVRWLRENLDLDGGYYIFAVSGIAYNVEHASSGTTGAEINVDVHKVEYYEQT